MSYGLFSPFFGLSFKKKSYHIILKFKKNIVGCPKLPCVRSSSTGILLGGGGRVLFIVWVLIIALECIACVELGSFLAACQILNPFQIQKRGQRCGHVVNGQTFTADQYLWDLPFFSSYTYCFCRQEREAPRCGSLGTGSNCCP